MDFWTTSFDHQKHFENRELKGSSLLSASMSVRLLRNDYLHCGHSPAINLENKTECNDKLLENPSLAVKTTLLLILIYCFKG